MFPGSSGSIWANHIVSACAVYVICVTSLSSPFAFNFHFSAMAMTCLRSYLANQLECCSLQVTLEETWISIKHQGLYHPSTLLSISMHTYQYAYINCYKYLWTGSQSVEQQNWWSYFWVQEWESAWAGTCVEHSECCAAQRKEKNPTKYYHQKYCIKQKCVYQSELTLKKLL